MGIYKERENANIKYLRGIVCDVLGEDLWKGLYDVITTERPRIDIYDGEDKITVMAEAPGILSPDDIFIATSSNRLNIKYTSRDKYQNNKPGKKIKGECIFDTFNRTIELPCAVDDGSIKAVYESGILEITMKKLHDIKSKNVKVEFR